MGEQAVIAALAVVGLALELVGLALVVGGIRADRRAARRATEGTSETDLRLTVRSALRLPFKVHGREPTLSERVERLEKRVAEVDEREQRTREEVQDYVNRKLSHVERAGIARDETLRRFLAEMLEGDLSRQAWGVGCFALGAVFAAASSVWGALAG